MTDASLEILFLLRSLSSKERNFGVGPHFSDFLGVSIAILKIFPTESLMKSLDRGPGQARDFFAGRNCHAARLLPHCTPVRTDGRVGERTGDFSKAGFDSPPPEVEHL